MGDDDDNLIEVQRWKVSDMPLLVHRNDAQRYCCHARTEVDDNKRTVTCRDCKASLDAFDVLLRIANQEMQLLYMRDKVHALREQVFELQKEERRIKARLKRARERDDGE